LDKTGQRLCPAIQTYLRGDPTTLSEVMATNREMGIRGEGLGKRLKLHLDLDLEWPKLVGPSWLDSEPSAHCLPTF